MNTVVIYNKTNLKSYVVICEDYEDVLKFFQRNPQLLCEKYKITVIDENSNTIEYNLKSHE